MPLKGPSDCGTVTVYRGMIASDFQGKMILEDKGFIDPTHWQQVLSEQQSPASPGSDDGSTPASSDSPVPSPSKKMIRRMGPWVFSILLHVLLVCIALVWVWREKPVQTHQPIIPTARFSAVVGAPVVNKSLDVAQTLPALDMDALMTPSFDALPGLDGTTVRDTAELLLPVDPFSQIQTLQQSPAILSQPRANPFAGLMPDALQPVAAFFGVAGNAKSIVYVVDASGSLVDTLPYVLGELRRSVMRLSKKQQFAVLFFQGKKVLQIPPVGLRHATDINKQQAVQWIGPDAGNLFASGQSDPLPAIKLALQYNPDLLFLLTDNLAANQQTPQDEQALLQQITIANRAQTAIHAIQFLYRDAAEKNPAYVPMLKRLADQHHGKYTFIDAKDLK